MTNNLLSETDDQAWQNFLNAWENYVSARKALLAETPALVELMRRVLVDPHQRLAALDLARYLKPEQIQPLLGNLIAIASYQGSGQQYAYELILTLPHEWLMTNIETYAEQVLSNEDELDYRGQFALYRQIDLNLARKLSERALASSNLAVKEAGEYFRDALATT